MRAEAKPKARIDRHAASESLSCSGANPFISNNTLMKIIGSQKSIGMARFLIPHVIFTGEEP
jgi:hypothetical protein